MKQLLTYEFRKIWRGKAFYICLIIAILLMAFSVWMVYDTYNLSLKFDPDATKEGIGLNNLLNVFSYTDMNIILAIFVAIVTTANVQTHTIKNIISHGYNRTKIMVSEYFASLIMTLGMIAILLLCSAIVNAWLFGFSGKVEHFAFYMFAGIWQLVAYHAVFFLISKLFRTSGSAIALCILGPVIVQLLISLIDLILLTKNIEVNLTSYLLSSLLTGEKYSTKLVTKVIVEPLIYIVVSFILSLLIESRREDK